MGEFLDQVPEGIQQHIRDITKTSGLEDTEESVEKMAQGWLEKKSIFEEKIASMDMEEIEMLEKDREDGVLCMTASGSLVNVGPLVEGGRRVEYTSIGIRADVPPAAEKEGSVLAGDIKVGQSIEFEVGPVKSTSELFKIAICKGDLSAEEQGEKITQATQVLQDEFVKVNKTVVIE